MKPHIYVGPWGWNVRSGDFHPPRAVANHMLAHNHVRKLNNTFPWNARRMDQMLKGLDAVIGPQMAILRARAGAA